MEYLPSDIKETPINRSTSCSCSTNIGYSSAHKVGLTLFTQILIRN